MSKALCLDSIKKFDYPDHILQVIEKGTEYLINELDKTCKDFTIILHGSSARGELTYSDSNCFSDIEFYVFTKYPIKKRVANKIRGSLIKYSKEFPYSEELFHFDVVFKSKLRRPFLQKDILNYELKKQGKILYGDENILNGVPEISIDNINIRTVNDIVLMRLSNLLKNVDDPKILKENISKDKRLSLIYSFYREVLDIVTVLLPNEGILGSTYQARHNRLKEIYKNPDIRYFFDDEFLKIEKEALEFKLIPNYLNSNHQNKNLYLFFKEIIGYYSKLLFYLGIKNNILDRSRLNGENFTPLEGLEETLNPSRTNDSLLYYPRPEGWGLLTGFTDAFRKGELNIFNDSILDIYGLAAKWRIGINEKMGCFSSLHLLGIPVKAKLTVSIYSLLLAVLEFMKGKKVTELVNFYITRVVDNLRKICHKEFSLTDEFLIDYKSLRKITQDIYSYLW